MTAQSRAGSKTAGFIAEMRTCYLANARFGSRSRECTTPVSAVLKQRRPALAGCPAPWGLPPWVSALLMAAGASAQVSFYATTTWPTGTNPYQVAVGDFNGDGKQDLATANQNTSNVSILMGDGLGGFAAAVNFGVGTYPFSVAVGDFNGDGKQDLATANGVSNDVSILTGDGLGGFAAAVNFGVGTYPFQVVVGDFNGDGEAGSGNRERKQQRRVDTDG